MNWVEDASLESRLAELLLAEADLATTTTDTARELERFQARTRRRRARARTLGVAAAVLLVIGGSLAAAGLARVGAHRESPPTGAGRVIRSNFGPAQPLPPHVAVATVPGPRKLGVAAFGAIWGVSGDRDHGVLYRMSLDGRRLLSQTPYPGVDGNANLNPDEGKPVRIGQAIVVPDGADPHYTVFNPAGQKIGRLPMTRTLTPAATGDASGGWVETSVDTLGQVDATGRHIVRTIQLPEDVSIAALASSPGRLWVVDGQGVRLLRIDTSTGTISGQTAFSTRLTKRVSVPARPVEVEYVGNAVYVSCQDFGLRRVDPATLAVTAIAFSPPGGAWPVVAASTDGQLWAEPSVGVISRLNPTTLRTERSIRLFPGHSFGKTYGAVVTGSRLYAARGRGNVMYSFPLH